MSDAILTHGARLNALENRLRDLEDNNNTIDNNIQRIEDQYVAFSGNVDNNFNELYEGLQEDHHALRNQLRTNNRIFNRLESLLRNSVHADIKIGDLRKENDKLAKQKAAKITLKKIAEGSTPAARAVASTRRTRSTIASFLSTTAGKRKKQTKKRSRK